MCGVDFCRLHNLDFRTRGTRFLPCWLFVSRLFGAEIKFTQSKSHVESFGAVGGVDGDGYMWHKTCWLASVNVLRRGLGEWMEGENTMDIEKLLNNPIEEGCRSFSIHSRTSSESLELHSCRRVQTDATALPPRASGMWWLIVVTPLFVNRIILRRRLSMGHQTVKESFT